MKKGKQTIRGQTKDDDGEDNLYSAHGVDPREHDGLTPPFVFSFPSVSCLNSEILRWCIQSRKIGEIAGWGKGRGVGYLWGGLYREGS